MSLCLPTAADEVFVRSAIGTFQTSRDARLCAAIASKAEIIRWSLELEMPQSVGGLSHHNNIHHVTSNPSQRQLIVCGWKATIINADRYQGDFPRRWACFAEMCRGTSFESIQIPLLRRIGSFCWRLGQSSVPHRKNYVLLQQRKNAKLSKNTICFYGKNIS